MTPLSPSDLNTLLNTWKEGTLGHSNEHAVIADLDDLGQCIGYGALEQLAHALYLVQCCGTVHDAAIMKRERFGLLGWKLPGGV